MGTLLTPRRRRSPLRWRALALTALAVGTPFILSPIHSAPAGETVLRVGLYDNPPKLFSSNGTPSGAFAELLQAIAREEGWQLRYVPCQWEACLAMLAAGELDLMPDVAWSEDRAARFDFHRVPALYSWSQLYRRDGVPIDSLLDLQGRRIALLASSIQADSLSNLLAGFNVSADFVQVQTLEEGFRLAASGEVDAAVASAYYGNLNAPRHDLEATPIMFQPVRLLFAAPRGGEAAVLAAIDRHLSQWQKTPGSPYFTIMRRWGMPDRQRPLPEWVPVVMGLGAGAGAAMALVILWLRRRVTASIVNLREANEHLEATLKSIPDLLFETDHSGRLLQIHTNQPELLARPEHELKNHTLREVLPPPAADIAMANVERALREGHAQGEVMELHLADGTHWFELSSARKAGSAGGDRVIVLSRDITERIIDKRRIQELAEFDQLTQLPNRFQLRRVTEHILADAHRNQYAVAILFMDLDHFKHINDSLGHEVGDALLKEAARRLSALCRENDITCRMGGDEFILVLPRTNVEGAAKLAVRIRTALQAPFQMGIHEVTAGVSLGIAMYPQDGDSLDELLRKADTAMYQAKASGRNDFRFFTATMQARSDRMLSLSSALAQALTRRQIEAHYQPIVALATGRVTGFEALMRWQHPELGDVSPAEFIPIAESTGQILQLGEWMLREATGTAAPWWRAGHRVTVAVNISAIQFRHRQFIAVVDEALAASGLPGELLEIELTESMAMGNPKEALTILAALRERGIRLAIDDFGTGYSSMSYLSRLGFHQLKIDRSFLAKVGCDPADEAIIVAIIKLARVLGMEVLAEGVETPQQLQFLRDHDCDLIQGWLVARAMPAADAARWLAPEMPCLVRDSGAAGSPGK